ncbi:hypothetical protein F5B20DRAFT_222678 [Whalleya microplaca]|nr:hypothetical protein F5B20DRAFT_222678 [Whalleya microplaca]
MDGWYALQPSWESTATAMYSARTVVVRRGYIVATSKQALYPVYIQEFSLVPDEPYLLRLVGKPTLADLGFWSITLFGSEGALGPNAVNRYSLGDRSNFNYPDGTLRYGTDVNGNFDILVQATQWPGNWDSR